MTEAQQTQLQQTQHGLLELISIRAGYGTIDVLHGVSLDIQPGQVMALLGPNGAGKSTTLGVASGQIVPSAGNLMLMGKEVTGTPPAELAKAGVCLIPEGRGIFPNLTVMENLRMITFAGVSFADVTERAFAQFPRLAERRKQLAGTLSGGEQQMLAMSRALACDPAVLMLDELSMGLAPIIVEELYEQVGQLAQSGLSILIVEQFAQSVLGVADEAAIMAGGLIQRIGAPDDIAEELTEVYLGIT